MRPGEILSAQTLKTPKVEDWKKMYRKFRLEIQTDSVAEVNTLKKRRKAKTAEGSDDR